MKTIGIKLADGSFYPILTEGAPDKKQLNLTTAKDNQTIVQVDLYRSETGSMADAEYVDSLEIKNLVKHPNGEPDINLDISIDENNELYAELHDPETGKESQTSVVLVSRTLAERTLHDGSSDITDATIDVVSEDSDALGDIDEENAIFEDISDFEQEDNRDNIIEENIDIINDSDSDNARDDFSDRSSDNAYDEVKIVDEHDLVDLNSIEASDSSDFVASVDSIDSIEENKNDDFDSPDFDNIDLDLSEIDLPKTLTEENPDGETSDFEVAEIDSSVDEAPIEAEESGSDETVVEMITEEPTFEVSEDGVADAAADEDDLDSFDDFSDVELDPNSLQFDSIVEEDAPVVEEDSEAFDSDAELADFDISEEEIDVATDSVSERIETSDATESLNDFENNFDSENHFDEDPANTDFLDETFANSAGLDFSDLLDEETIEGKAAGNSDDDIKKKTKVPVIICIVCAIICVIAALLTLFVIPSKFNLVQKSVEKKIEKEENPAKNQVETLPKIEVQAEESKPIVTEIVVEKEEVAEPPAPKHEAKVDEIVVAPAEEVVPEIPAPKKEVKKVVTYKIKWGDTLWDLAKSYYNNPWKYPKIAKANGIKNPDHIISGTVIEIPE